jgi:DMSO/TMAO reductase YedYZ molybdopterin-dependent catalytic subunit
MPNAHFYVRNHFDIPDLDPAIWRLAVKGRVERPLSLSLNELRSMPSLARIVTLECAGNGRSLMRPAVPGERWDLGAVSTAEWTGVPLIEVLELAGPLAGAREVIFRGADAGRVEGRTATVPFERSLTLDVARQRDVLLAYAMNGEPLPVQHGFPVRLIVPNWYAVASVKWLTAIDVVDEPFTGYYQTEKYVYEWERDGRVVREPVGLQHVRALIVDPAWDREIRRGPVTVRGVAWSGDAPIARVDVSAGGGPWQEAHLLGDGSRQHWQWWELPIQMERPGASELRARATDLAGASQPERPEWNRLGYGNNAIHAVRVLIV